MVVHSIRIAAALRVLIAGSASNQERTLIPAHETAHTARSLARQKCMRGCIAYRPALERELRDVPVADVEYDAHVRALSRDT